MNKSELLLSGKLLNRILPFHRFLLRVILLKIHQLHRAAVLRIFGTFSRIVHRDTAMDIVHREARIKRPVRTADHVGEVSTFGF